MEPHCLFPRLSAWPMRGTLVLQLNSPKDLSLSLSLSQDEKQFSPATPSRVCIPFWSGANGREVSLSFPPKAISQSRRLSLKSLS